MSLMDLMVSVFFLWPWWVMECVFGLPGCPSYMHGKQLFMLWSHMRCCFSTTALLQKCSVCIVHTCWSACMLVVSQLLFTVVRRGAWQMVPMKCYHRWRKRRIASWLLPVMVFCCVHTFVVAEHWSSLSFGQILRMFTMPELLTGYFID